MNAAYLVTTGAEAEARVQHKMIVVESLWEILVDGEAVGVAALPVLEEERADGAVEAACEECEEAAGGEVGRRGEELVWDVARQEVDLWDADILCWLKAFRGVGVTESPNGVGVELRMASRSMGAL